VVRWGLLTGVAVAGMLACINGAVMGEGKENAEDFSTERNSLHFLLGRAVVSMLGVQ
jgi:hypothetical protein